MFTQSKLHSALAMYKANFTPEWWKEEKYKWIAIQNFQDNWKPESANFAEMLDKSLKKARNLLDSFGTYPKDRIVELTKYAPEEVRSMYKELFDESSDVVKRIADFKIRADALWKKYDNSGRKHCQDESAISVYLWLRFPNKYYIFKLGIVQKVAKFLETDYTFTKGEYNSNMRNFYKFYDELCDEIKKDTEAVDILNSYINTTDGCYRDEEHKTLTADFGFYISRAFARTAPAEYSGDGVEWFGLDYDPGLTVEDWSILLRDTSVFNQNALEIMKRLKDYGGMATCTQLAQKYGENKNFYNSGSVALARRVCDAAGIEPNTREDGSTQWWTVLYVGRSADEDETGSFVWKLRDELSEALDGFDLSGVRLHAAADNKVRYWFCAPGRGASIWDECVRDGIIAIGWEEIGDFRQYHSKAEIAEKLKEVLEPEKNYLSTAKSLWEFAEVMKPGDIVFAKNGRHSVIGRGVVEGDYEYDPARDDLKNIRRVRWTDIAEYPYPGTAPQKTLTEITDKDLLDKLNALYDNSTEPAEEAAPDAYTEVDFLSEVYMTEKNYDDLVGILKNKKNIILQGAPGVGKTFAARRLAWSVMGEKDDSRIEQVQFHQNYSYEDFVMGYKPVENGFELRYGVFYRFCQKAANQPDKDFFFIIDEINRGNMSKIFGELLMLIENDYRGSKLTLAYNGFPFSVPKNLYIIGMMNTADRSLAMIDYALRRRFSFFEMTPGFDSEGFKNYQNGLNSDMFNDLIQKIKELNREISLDKSLGKGFCIGHSYFCGRESCTEDWLRSVVNYDIIPMLSEYWFDDAAKLQRWENILKGTVND